MNERNEFLIYFFIFHINLKFNSNMVCANVKFICLCACVCMLCCLLHTPYSLVLVNIDNKKIIMTHKIKFLLKNN